MVSPSLASSGVQAGLKLTERLGLFVINALKFVMGFTATLQRRERNLGSTGNTIQDKQELNTSSVIPLVRLLV